MWLRQLLTGPRYRWFATHNYWVKRRVGTLCKDFGRHGGLMLAVAKDANLPDGGLGYHLYLNGRLYRSLFAGVITHLLPEPGTYDVSVLRTSLVQGVAPVEYRFPEPVQIRTDDAQIMVIRGSGRLTALPFKIRAGYASNVLNNFDAFADVDCERHEPPQSSLRDGDDGNYTTLAFGGPFGYSDPRRGAMYTRADGTIVNEGYENPPLRTDTAARHYPPLHKWWMSSLNAAKWYAILTAVVVLGGDLLGGWSATFLSTLVAFNIGHSLLWIAFTRYTSVAINWTYVDVSDHEIAVRRRLRKPRTVKLSDVTSVEATTGRWRVPVLRFNCPAAAADQRPFDIDYTRYNTELLTEIRQHLKVAVTLDDVANELLAGRSS